MSHFPLLDKMKIHIGETKTTINLYHRYKDNDTDVLTDWWIKASDAERMLAKVYADDPTTFKNRDYVKKLEDENRLLQSKLKQLKTLLS
jgi:hypothetical protein